MIDVWLRATIQWCLRVLLLAIVAGGLRIGYVAYARRPSTVTYRDVRTPSETAPPRAPFGLDALQSQLAPAVPSDLLRETVSGIAGAKSRPPPHLRVYLVVNVGPDRSEILINGVSHGNTPYVGEISCQSGNRLNITIVPVNGMPKHFERECDRREIRIDE